MNTPWQSLLLILQQHIIICRHHLRGITDCNIIILLVSKLTFWPVFQPSSDALPYCHVPPEVCWDD
jgi:hypothetical protein